MKDKVKIFGVDLGILLEKEDVEFEQYACAYDKQHGYFDECQYGCRAKAEAIEAAKAYVQAGVEGTYGIVTDQGCYPDDVDLEALPGGEFSYELDTVVYSVCKKGGILVEGFIATE